MSSKVKASEDLLSFLDTYTQLMNDHIADVQDTMSKTVEETMSNIMEMSQKSKGKAAAANQILVSRKEGEAAGAEVDPSSDGAGSDRYFKAADLDTSDQRVSSVTSKEDLKAQLEAAGVLDKKVQEKALEMVGFLSSDDVIAQRLGNVSKGLHILKQAISQLLSRSDPEAWQQSTLENYLGSVAAALNKAYTSEQEKKEFHRLFYERPL